MRSDNKPVLDEIKNIFDDHIVQNMTELDSTNNIVVNEVELFDSFVLSDMDADPKKTNIDFLEKVPDTSIFGIEIPKLSHNEIMQGRSLAAIDGSSAVVNRPFISMVVAKSGMGSYSKGNALPLTRSLDEDFFIVVSTDQVVTKDHPKIKKFTDRIARDDALNMNASTLQAKLESNSIKDVIDTYEAVDIIGIDGPLYFRQHVDLGFKNVQYAIDEGKTIFSIVKRSQDDSVIKFLQRLGDNTPIKKITKGWYHTDRDFFRHVLHKGHRSPFYIHINNQESDHRIRNSLKRVCSWVRLEGGKVCRVEIPFEMAGVENSFNQAEDIVSMIYFLSRENKGVLPGAFDKSDLVARINMGDRMRYGSMLDSFLQPRGFETDNPDNWK